MSFHREQVAGVADALGDLPLRPFLCDARDRLVVHGDLESLVRFLSAYSARVDLSGQPLVDAEGGLRFFGLLGTPAAVREGFARIAPFRGDGLDFFTADFFRPDVAMLMARPRVTKGAALEAVAARLGIAREAVAAVGDWVNDVEMLDYAGLAAAMPESAPEVVAAADIVLPFGPEEDGVARFIEDLLTAGR